MRNAYVALAQSIISQQELVVGSLARVEADKVSGLTISNGDITIDGDGKKILEALVNQYAKLFGQASVEVCKGAVQRASGDLEKVALPDVLA